MGEQKRGQNIAFNVMITILVVVVIVSVSIYYVGSIKQNVTEETSEYLGEITRESAKLVSEKFNSGLDILTAMATVIGVMDAPIDDEAVIRALQEEIKSVNFQNIAVERLDGQAYSVNKKTYYDVSEMAYFKQASKGAPNISLLDADNGSQNAVVLAVPVFREGTVIGVLAGSYFVEDLIDLLRITTFGGEGYSYLSTNTGMIIAASDHPNAAQSMTDVYKGFDECDFEDPYAVQDMKLNMKSGISGEIGYDLKGDQRIMSYTPVGINSWYLLSVVPESVIVGKSSYLISQAAFLAIILFVVFTVVIVYVYNLQKRKSVALKVANQEIIESQKRYDLIMGQCEEIIFEWNVKDKTVYYSRYFKEKFGLEPAREGFPENAVERGIIFEEDVAVFRAFFNDAVTKEDFIEQEMRIVNGDGEPVWCKVRALSIADGQGVIYKIIGIISDVNEEKEEWARMSEAVSRDFLTKLYNKGASENRMRHFMAEAGEQQGAVFVVDIDDFKSINDNFGHIYGDQVLQEVAKRLSAAMRDSDVVGRIGGDEFIILMKDVDSESILRRKAQALVDTLSKPLENDLCTISASIGVARYPEDGDSYESLFKKADEALYLAKEYGKNQYMIYGEKEVIE